MFTRLCLALALAAQATGAAQNSPTPHADPSPSPTSAETAALDAGAVGAIVGETWTGAAMDQALADGPLSNDDTRKPILQLVKFHTPDGDPDGRGLWLSDGAEWTYARTDTVRVRELLAEKPFKHGCLVRLLAWNVIKTEGCTKTSASVGAAVDFTPRTPRTSSRETMISDASDSPPPPLNPRSGMSGRREGATTAGDSSDRAPAPRGGRPPRTPRAADSDTPPTSARGRRGRRSPRQPRAADGTLPPGSSRSTPRGGRGTGPRLRGCACRGESGIAHLSCLVQLGARKWEA